MENILLKGFLKGLRRLRRSLYSRAARSRRGQATTEVVLLFPLFIIVVLVTMRMFALLVLVQKLEIASYYAARRWQLESHLSADHVGWDSGTLLPDIIQRTSDYLGYGGNSGKFIGLVGSQVKIEVKRTQVWNEVTLTVETASVAGDLRRLICPSAGSGYVCGGDTNCEAGYKYVCVGTKELFVTKYVPNRDRPIQFELPGIRE